MSFPEKYYVMSLKIKFLSKALNEKQECKLQSVYKLATTYCMHYSVVVDCCDNEQA